MPNKYSVIRGKPLRRSTRKLSLLLSRLNNISHYSLINTARNFFSKLFADHVQVVCHTHDIQRRDHVTSRKERWPLEWELRVTLRYHMTSSTGNVRWKALKEIDQVARESSRPKSCRLNLKPKSCCPKFK